jgi:hypothetical protein
MSVILFEDIDNVDAAIGVKAGLDKDSKKVTLDGLLNAIDGVQRGASKRILIATTNYPEKLVPSLRRCRLPVAPRSEASTVQVPVWPCDRAMSVRVYPVAGVDAWASHLKSPTLLMESSTPWYVATCPDVTL